MAKVKQPIKQFWESDKKPDWFKLSKNNIVEVVSKDRKANLKK